MRQQRSSATPASRLAGRAGLAVLALLALLGILAMHGTPMPVMSAGPAMSAVGDVNTGHGLPGPMTSGVTAAGNDPYAIGVGGAGDHDPQPAHVTAPCVSDSARSQVHALAPAAAPLTPVAAARRLAGAAALPRARADRSPPDLSELCISRT